LPRQGLLRIMLSYDDHMIISLPAKGQESFRVNQLKRVNLSRECLRAIQQYIAERNLQPGDKLPSHQEWAQMLGVSPVVVREAFQAARALGMVDIRHGRGIFVRAPEEMDFLDFLSFLVPVQRLELKEVIEARAMLEFTVLQACIARADSGAISRLWGLLDRLSQKPPLAGVDSSEHRAFHYELLRSCGNSLLHAIGIPLLNTFWTLGNTGHIELDEQARQVDTVEIHAAYVEAIERRDPSRLAELVDRQLLGLCSRYRVFPYATSLVPLGIASGC
jgi:GntR family transcriptional repressor for pyruvate dehydrogenase complex